MKRIAAAFFFRRLHYKTSNQLLHVMLVLLLSLRKKFVHFDIKINSALLKKQILTHKIGHDKVVVIRQISRKPSHGFKRVRTDPVISLFWLNLILALVKIIQMLWE